MSRNLLIRSVSRSTGCWDIHVLDSRSKARAFIEGLGEDDIVTFPAGTFRHGLYYSKEVAISRNADGKLQVAGVPCPIADPSWSQLLKASEAILRDAFNLQQILQNEDETRAFLWPRDRKVAPHVATVAYIMWQSFTSSPNPRHVYEYNENTKVTFESRALQFEKLVSAVPKEFRTPDFLGEQLDMATLTLPGNSLTQEWYDNGDWRRTKDAMRNDRIEEAKFYWDAMEEAKHECRPVTRM
ncbi:hypothetical protein ACFOY8_15075 [Thalassospira xianhensis]|uniref:Uncharacterized protein n=1 Tax=Thalassospira xianhensis MCCC 1A02616 TaxID=1177929 RepID=A0A367UIQ9_9PROT|nr:hypothetical protein [Thalassospira xianhensis]RCK07533.1 hypothetical protein TH5_00150 [Thalassospira xianhensis MCCC 1A02616]